MHPMSIEKVSSNEVKEPLLDLKVKGLLVSYQLRREELLRCFDYINKSIQVFLAGTFLLIAYASYSKEPLLLFAIPVIMFVLFNFLLYFLQFIFINEERCIEIERKVGELLKDDRILCFEKEYCRLSRKWIKSKTHHIYYALVGMMVVTYIFFSGLALYFTQEILGSEIMYVVTIILIILFLICISNSLNVLKLRVECL